VNGVKPDNSLLSYTCMIAAGASHGPHWLAERAAAAALLGVIPAAFFVQGPAMDALLSTSLVLHAHWYVIFMPVGLAVGFTSTDRRISTANIEHCTLFTRHKDAFGAIHYKLTIGANFKQVELHTRSV